MVDRCVDVQTRPRDAHHGEQEEPDDRRVHPRWHQVIVGIAFAAQGEEAVVVVAVGLVVGVVVGLAMPSRAFFFQALQGGPGGQPSQPGQHHEEEGLPGGMAEPGRPSPITSAQTLDHPPQTPVGQHEDHQARSQGGGMFQVH